MRLNRACVASVALTRKSRSEFRSAKRAQTLKIICKNLKLEQTMDYDENANLALGYVAAVTTAIKRMLTERERQQLLVERRKTDQDRLKQLAKKVVVDDKLVSGFPSITNPNSRSPFRHLDFSTSVTAELRSNPSLPARTRVPELAVEYYTVLRAQAKGATNLVAGVSSKSEQRIQDIQEVFNQATVLSPCLLFFDDINAISANRVTAQKDMERQIVAQLLCSLDGLCESKKVTRCSSSVLPTGGMRSTRPCVAPVALNRKSGSKLRSAKRALRIWKSPNSRRPSTTTNSPVTSEQLCWRWSPARPRTLTAVGRGHSRALSGNPAPQSGTGMTQATCQEGRRR
ncbi:ribosome biogenesis ATPase RIX7 [Culex quinquefasciatus]|uniref:Ribosome biogenesis ATPase RIX7 n=1 Tax=Culex quinquefasciatus TaxID=7176 RepID=B0X094_CULQU|nr:ribosome biogenesis ATPase RIX7 [Culex quinquefasciatus]|eukprot:XP_001863066.1 ribosome biogenesis ATPase RIX7 [Culex quinquefasciatus]